MEKTLHRIQRMGSRISIVLILLTSIYAFTPNSNTTSDDLIDLSLILKVSDAVPEVGDKVSVNITLANLSQINASGVDVVVNVPEGLGNFSCISKGGIVRGNQLIWPNRNIGSNSSNGFLFNTQILSEGDYVLTAEIVAADQQDVDSYPGNGVDPNRNNLIGSYDMDSSYDADDEDDADDAMIQVRSNQEIAEVIQEEEVEQTPDQEVKRQKDIVSIFPNPTSGNLNVAITQRNEGAVEIIMYDQNGNHIMTRAVDKIEIGTKVEHLLDVSNLAAGTYVLNVKIGDTSYIKRAMLVH